MRGSTGAGRRIVSTTRTDIARGRGPGREIGTGKGDLDNIFMSFSASTLDPFKVEIQHFVYRETRSSSDARVKEEPRREDRGGEPRREERSDSHRERR